MKKLYCFYNDREFVISENYKVLSCPQEDSVYDFLNQTETEFFSEMKIIQINFEAGHENLFTAQKPLYDAPKATVFILNEYKIVEKSEALARLSSDTIKKPEFKSFESRSVFIEKVNLLKKEIANGRIYQVNLTAPLAAETGATAEVLFKYYYSELNGNYQALLPLSDALTAISFSPELFLQKKGPHLITRPIKGSLKSGLSFAKDLITNEKENAELSMIVDLLRNDLNHIGGSAATVTKHRAQLQLGYIQHSYSEVELQTEEKLPHILNCTFPGGSISGCPKTESLKVISELETYRRQIYTGSIGWWKENDFTLNLAIRTFAKHDDQLYYHAGCGIVYDSVAEAEWDEFILKTGKLNAKF